MEKVVRLHISVHHGMKKIMKSQTQIMLTKMVLRMVSAMEEMARLRMLSVHHGMNKIMKSQTQIMLTKMVLRMVSAMEEMARLRMLSVHHGMNKLLYKEITDADYADEDGAENGISNGGNGETSHVKCASWNEQGDEILQSEEDMCSEVVAETPILKDPKRGVKRSLEMPFDVSVGPSKIDETLMQKKSKTRAKTTSFTSGPVPIPNIKEIDDTPRRSYNLRPCVIRLRDLNNSSVKK
ncbi:uncharacterized protein [Amphiura filiformis]|uniref:uncharacterized protein n=1 Tax=Amphiura filiformis TaxID=82378 RepID=UPI003B21CCD0